MKFLQKMERKFGRHAIPGLTRFIIAAYAIGYLFSFINPGILNYLTLEPALIFRGQVWRLITWILIPPSGSNILFFVIMLVFYYSIGRNLERTWGDFRYNVYIFGGLIFTILSAFICYGIGWLIYGGAIQMGGVFSTYYVCMSIFLAYALTYPDMQVMLYFIIPIKVKWLGIVYAAVMIYQCIYMSWVGRVAVVASLLNFILFFLLTRNFKRYSPKERKRRKTFQQAVRQPEVKPGQPRHRCAVCGRTELDDPTLEFRYCSKCNGNYEYCQDHLFTHTHVK